MDNKDGMFQLTEVDLDIIERSMRVYKAMAGQVLEACESQGFKSGAAGIENDMEKIGFTARTLGISV